MKLESVCFCAIGMDNKGPLELSPPEAGFGRCLGAGEEPQSLPQIPDSRTGSALSKAHQHSCSRLGPNHTHQLSLLAFQHPCLLLISQSSQELKQGRALSSLNVFPCQPKKHLFGHNPKVSYQPPLKIALPLAIPPEPKLNIGPITPPLKSIKGVSCQRRAPVDLDRGDRIYQTSTQSSLRLQKRWRGNSTWRNSQEFEEI